MKSDLGCNISVKDQIATLRELRDGWLDGEGVSYDPAELDWVESLVTTLTIKYLLPMPFIYPSPEPHQVSLEWEFNGGTDFTLNTESKTAELKSVPRNTFLLGDKVGVYLLGAFLEALSSQLKPRQ